MDKENEYKKVLSFLKRWTKSPSTPSYTRGYSAGNGDKEPAKKTYDYILLLGKDSTNTFEGKLNSLDKFLEEVLEEESNRPYMCSPFYSNIRTHIKREKRNIENGIPAQTRRK